MRKIEYVSSFKVKEKRVKLLHPVGNILKIMTLIIEYIHIKYEFRTVQSTHLQKY